jgi:hypothetical protein
MRKIIMRREFTTVVLFFFGLIIIRSILLIINDLRDEWIYGIYILFTFMMIYLLFFFLNSSKLKNDSIIPLGIYPKNPLDKNNKEMKPICLKCGKEITIETKICPECGHTFP